MEHSHWSRSLEILCSDWLDHDVANAIKTQLKTMTFTVSLYYNIRVVSMHRRNLLKAMVSAIAI